MPMHLEMGPFCQSCAMPLSRPEDFGTDANGFHVNDYCTYCFKGGVFTDPDITMAQMIDNCVAVMTQRGIMRKADARKMLTAVMPNLKRWHLDRGEPVGPGLRREIW